MEAASNQRQTPLYTTHRELGARMVPFGGWAMPVQYSGVVSEHMAVRNAAGLFDVSHMGEIELSGTTAGETVQYLTCNDVSRLDDGDAQYSALMTASGGILDDLIVYRRQQDRFLLVVNAGNTAAALQWIQEHARQGTEVVDRSDDLALLAVQGPRAAELLGTMTDLPIGDLAAFQFAEGPVGGVPATVARTGYTGEDGFEILVAADAAVRLWAALMERGRPMELLPAGLGARDTLRLEAGLLLHGNDMTVETSPLEAGLGFIVKLGAGEFLGRDVLVRQKEQGVTRRQRGLEMIDPGIARSGHRLWIDGEVQGEVTSGSHVPFLKKNLARAYLPAGNDVLGTEVEVEVRRRRLRARVVKTPFYRRG